MKSVPEITSKPLGLRWRYPSPHPVHLNQQIILNVSHPNDRVLCVDKQVARIHFFSEPDKKYNVRFRQIAHILDPDSDPHEYTTPIVYTNLVSVRQSPYIDTFHKHHHIKLSIDVGDTEKYNISAHCQENKHFVRNTLYIAYTFWALLYQEQCDPEKIIQSPTPRTIVSKSRHHFRSWNT